MSTENKTEHDVPQSRSTAGLGAELEQELRAAINPLYEDQRGTESYERKRLLGEIDMLREILGITRGNILSIKNCVGVGVIAYDIWLDEVNKALRIDVPNV